MWSSGSPPMKLAGARRGGSLRHGQPVRGARRVSAAEPIVPGHARIMPLKGSRRMDALAGRSPRRRSRRLRLAMLISLLIHAAIAVLLLVTIRRKGTEEMLPPPAPVTMCSRAAGGKARRCQIRQSSTRQLRPSVPTPPVGGKPRFQRRLCRRSSRHNPQPLSGNASAPIPEPAPPPPPAPPRSVEQPPPPPPAPTLPHCRRQRNRRRSPTARAGRQTSAGAEAAIGAATG